ncbi:MAG: methylated-DNA-[protein]-cysteine S-methyltransferase [Oceanospirillaceae bacterium]|jgi:methylated-DNA-[protein]-cysteine S-methyltransferase
MQHINIEYMPTPFGELMLGTFNQQLCLCDWRYRKMRNAVDNRIKRLLDASYVEQTDNIIAQTKTELVEYFSGTRQKFDVPLLLVGTNFQQSVWQQLLKVKYGTTSSYLSLAQAMDNAKAIRAVAAANGANGISIIVPCHRIIGSDGKLVGYAGGLSSKERLLHLEANTVGKHTLTHSLELF